MHRSLPTPTTGQTLEPFADRILAALGQQLECDRVFLYLRSPHSAMGRVPFCWRRHADIPLVYDVAWQAEPASLAANDPMFAAALACQPSIFVADVETANPDLLNRDFEHQEFGHRALIHGHICVEGQLWGVLQPCIFGQPRPWTDAARDVTQRAIDRLAPLVVEYVKRESPQS